MYRQMTTHDTQGAHGELSSSGWPQDARASSMAAMHLTLNLGHLRFRVETADAHAASQSDNVACDAQNMRGTYPTTAVSPEVQGCDRRRACRQPVPQQRRVDGATMLRRVLAHVGVHVGPHWRGPGACGRPAAAHQRQRAVPAAAACMHMGFQR